MSRFFVSSLAALILLSILACTLESDPDSDPKAQKDQGNTPSTEMGNEPDGPINHMLDPTTVSLDRANNSEGKPESNADLCMGSTSRDPRDSVADPRRGVVLRAGKPCVDLLIMRFTVPGSGGAASLGWSPNFTNALISKGQPGDRARLVTGVPTDGSAVSVSIDTIPNLLTGGDRVRLTFEASIKPKSEGSSFYEMTIAEVEVTPL